MIDYDLHLNLRMVTFVLTMRPKALKYLMGRRLNVYDPGYRRIPGSRLQIFGLPVKTFRMNFFERFRFTKVSDESHMM